jgi:hypothetical protein
VSSFFMVDILDKLRFIFDLRNKTFIEPSKTVL